MVKTFGMEKEAIHMGNNRAYTLWFWLADVELPWLGVDFLDKFNLRVDVKNCFLLNKNKLTGKYSGRNLDKEKMSNLTGQEEVPFRPGINYTRMAACQTVKNLQSLRIPFTTFNIRPT